MRVTKAVALSESGDDEEIATYVAAALTFHRCLQEGLVLDQKKRDAKLLAKYRDYKKKSNLLPEPEEKKQE